MSVFIESGVAMNEIVERFDQWLDDYLAQGYEFPYKTYYDSEYQIEIVDFDSTLEISMFDSFEGIRDEYRDWETDRKSTRLNSSHSAKSRMPSSA